MVVLTGVLNTENVIESPKMCSSVRVIEPVRLFAPDVYSPYAGVGISGCQDRSPSVSGFVSWYPSWIAVIGRQKLQYFFVFHAVIAASAAVRFAKAKSRALSPRLVMFASEMPRRVRCHKVKKLSE